MQAKGSGDRFLISADPHMPQSWYAGPALTPTVTYPPTRLSDPPTDGQRASHMSDHASWQTDQHREEFNEDEERKLKNENFCVCNNQTYIVCKTRQFMAITDEVTYCFAEALISTYMVLVL